MQVLVMRHGIAIERADWHEHDASRPLSESGAKKTRLAARGLKYLCPSIDLIASSPLARAAQTAEIVRDEAKLAGEIVLWPEAALLAEEAADLTPLLERLRSLAMARAPEHLLLVGHEPGCTRLLSLLMCSDAGALELEWKKAGVASVEFENGALRWFASPKILRALARMPRP